MNDHRGYAGDMPGQWIEEKDGGFHFIADAVNLDSRTEEQIRAYFKQVEPGAQGITCATNQGSLSG